MEINLDFDGTVVLHTFPDIDPTDIGAEKVLKDLVDKGHRLILFTMRSDEYLHDAVKWFSDRNIPLYGVQTNPTQHKWTNSPKSYAPIMIDDSALGCPLVHPDEGRPYVDWVKIRKLLVERKVL